MAVYVSRKKKQRKSDGNELGFVEKIMVKVPAAIFMLAFIYIWSSSTTILSGDIVHVCTGHGVGVRIRQHAKEGSCLRAGDFRRLEIYM
ncbi:xyloglucan-specific galacturonosyltransferase 1-like [Salvia divinorum]|uniref:Xyloglucan-specific galacturonosyltransferase 1-like n=1 Tax=Salvia divinorum TaxID=28513 RepID=A0ABD1H9V1_SALDI